MTESADLLSSGVPVRFCENIALTGGRKQHIGSTSRQPLGGKFRRGRLESEVHICVIRWAPSQYAHEADSSSAGRSRMCMNYWKRRANRNSIFWSARTEIAERELCKFRIDSAESSQTKPNQDQTGRAIRGDCRRIWKENIVSDRNAGLWQICKPPPRSKQYWEHRSAATSQRSKAEKAMSWIFDLLRLSSKTQNDQK